MTSTNSLSSVVSLARAFIAHQTPDKETTRRADTPQGRALRAYEAQRPIGARAFAKINVAQWVELRHVDKPNTFFFVTHVFGSKRTPAVHGVHAQPEKVSYRYSRQIWPEDVVAVHTVHRTGTPFALLAAVANGLNTQTCSTESDPNDGTYFELVVGDARKLTLDMVQRAMVAALKSAGFRNTVRSRNLKNGTPQWFASGIDYNVRVRLCGTATTAFVEIDFALKHRSKFRRK